MSLLDLVPRDVLHEIFYQLDDECLRQIRPYILFLDDPEDQFYKNLYVKRFLLDAYPLGIEISPMKQCFDVSRMMVDIDFYTATTANKVSPFLMYHRSKESCNHRLMICCQFGFPNLFEQIIKGEVNNEFFMTDCMAITLISRNYDMFECVCKFRPDLLCEMTPYFVKYRAYPLIKKYIVDDPSLDNSYSASVAFRQICAEDHSDYLPVYRKDDEFLNNRAMHEYLGMYEYLLTNYKQLSINLADMLPRSEGNTAPPIFPGYVNLLKREMRFGRFDYFVSDVHIELAQYFLQFAVRSGCVEMVKILLDLGYGLTYHDSISSDWDGEDVYHAPQRINRQIYMVLNQHLGVKYASPYSSEPEREAIFAVLYDYFLEKCFDWKYFISLIGSLKFLKLYSYLDIALAATKYEECTNYIKLEKSSKHRGSADNEQSSLKLKKSERKARNKSLRKKKT